MLSDSRNLNELLFPNESERNAAPRNRTYAKSFTISEYNRY